MVGNTRTQACNQGLPFGKQINLERSYFQEVRDSSYSDTRRWMQLSELLLEDTLNPSIISITSLFFYTSWSLMELSCVCFWRWHYGELWRLMSGIWGMGELHWRRYLWPWLWLSRAIRFAGKILGGLGINIIALTGPAPDLDVWKQALLECLKEGATCWAHVFPNSSWCPLIDQVPIS
jgi:hypothetical protein